MKNLATLLILILVAGCDVNIGGAGFDNEAVKTELENFPNFMSSKLTESVTKNCEDKAKQEFENIFSDFNYTVRRLEGKAQKITDNLNAKFINRVLSITDQSSNTLVTENLPSAFYMHPVRVGVDKISDNPIIMIVNKSRATTGRYFVAIYLHNGEPIYRKILKASEVWDIAIKENAIRIIGACNTRVVKWANT
jgi:hypothetical protein